MLPRCSLPAVLVLASTVVVGCADEPETVPFGEHDFLSDDPADRDGSNGDGDSAGAGGGSSSGDGGGGVGEEPPADGGDDPERVIEEADILQLDGDRLYALSAYAGLTVIDVSDPTNMVILGGKKLGGEPFEMYRVDDLVYAMFRSWGHYEEAEDGYWSWVSTSHIEVIDVADAASLDTVGSFEVPGYLSDSRLVGDVLYTVSFEDGYCWSCQSTANTTVTSLSVGNPADIQIVDQLSLPEQGYDGWGRSIHVTTDRIYIGGPDWDFGGQASTIDVVDISDPAGGLVAGAQVAVSGQILNRWQMDEHEGVFRVISQPWDSAVNPKVQTFSVASSSQIDPLGQTDLVLPEPESLRSVRFDGDRAYAITAMQIDPLFTVDLSDPANPVQRGELEMPGWVFHLEPRGDRVLALGFDNQSTEGSLHVSLFDVSDMDQPTMIERVHFGGDWGGFAEDQDRIHKAFKVLPDLGLLLVPFSAWDWDDNGCGGYDSGIQLIDWQSDTLVKRGVAPVRGNARRAFLLDDHLVALSDEQVRTFDFSDRDNPSKTGELQLSAHVSKSVVVGEHMVRMAADWWTSEPRLELVPLSSPDQAQALGALDLGAMLAEAEDDPSCYHWSYWDVRLFALGNTVVLVWPSWDGNVARVATVDVSTPTAPALLAHVDVPVDSYSYYGWYFGSNQLVTAGDTIALAGDKLVLAQLDWPMDEWGYASPWSQGPRGGKVRVLDLADPALPALSPPMPMPVGLGHTGFQVHDGHVYFSHWTPAKNKPGKVRFYVDRLLPTSQGAVLLPPVNVPGSLVHYDAASGHVLTVDYERRSLHKITAQVCYDAHSYDAWFEYDDENCWEYGDCSMALGSCTWFERTLKLSALDHVLHVATQLDEYELAANGWVSNVHSGDNRTFFVANEYTLTGEYYDYQARVWAIGGMRQGELAVANAPLQETWWASPIGAFGNTLVAASSPGAVITVDATDLDALEIDKVGDLPWWLESVTFHEQKGYLSLGPWGMLVVDL